MGISRKCFRVWNCTSTRHFRRLRAPLTSLACPRLRLHQMILFVAPLSLNFLGYRRYRSVQRCIACDPKPFSCNLAIDLHLPPSSWPPRTDRWRDRSRPGWRTDPWGRTSPPERWGALGRQTPRYWPLSRRCYLREFGASQSTSLWRWWRAWEPDQSHRLQRSYKVK